jgi:hypothetical protein
MNTTKLIWKVVVFVVFVVDGVFVVFVVDGVDGVFVVFVVDGVDISVELLPINI